MKKSHHFYTVFNPMINKPSAYESQAHEFYFTLKQRVLSQEFNQPYLYWGKLNINSSDFEYDKLQKVLVENEKIGQDTHLYITDYHQIWIAKISSVQKSIPSMKDTLSFYEGKEVGLWFKVTDMDLVSAEFEETSYYLANFYVDNQYVEEKIDAIHPYLGGLNFPLVIQDKINHDYFKKIHVEDTLKIVQSNPLIENFHGASHLKRQFKSFVLPPQVFFRLSSNVKNELVQAETILGKKESTSHICVLNSYLRILESVLNETLGGVLKEQFGSCLFVDEKGENLSDQSQQDFIPLSNFQGNLCLSIFEKIPSDVSHFGNLSLEQAHWKYSDLIKYFINELIPFIRENELVALRSKLLDFGEIQHNREFVYHVRNQILGVGTVGFINNLISLYMRSEIAEQRRSA